VVKYHGSSKEAALLSVARGDAEVTFYAPSLDAI